jgi:hypothetical protein
MAKVQVTKTWTITPNVRLTPFVSLNATMGWWLYQNKLAMLTAGWTLVGTSNGVTAAFDGAGGDRWTSAAVGPLTRGAAAANPQSWAIMQNADGVQVLFAYQGATDDIARISMSQGGLFVLAGTTTHQPTATDEVIASTAATVINATASADRVMSIGCTTEQWYCATFRSGAIVQYMSVDKVDSACDLVTLARPYVISRLTSMLADVFNIEKSINTSVGSPAAAFVYGAASFVGIATRVVTGGTGRIILVGGGARCAPNGGNLINQSCGACGPGTSGALGSQSGGTNTTQPALNGGNIPVFTIDWFGQKAANVDGYFGSPIDWWYGHTNVTTIPALQDMIAALAPGDTQASALRSNWLVCFGSGVIRPWLNAAATLQIT